MIVGLHPILMRLEVSNAFRKTLPRSPRLLFSTWRPWRKILTLLLTLLLSAWRIIIIKN